MFFISWRLITLQYYSEFCHTLKWISHGSTCVPIPIPPPISLSTRSLCVFPVHQVWVLVSCIQPGLVICFTLDNIHVLMLFSWNTPPSSFLRVQKSVLYICVSFSVLQTNVIFIPCACHDKFGKISTSLVNLHTYNFWGTGRWHAAYGSLIFFKTIFKFIFNWRIITVLCWFLLYDNVNQLCVYACTLPLEHSSHLPTPPL